MAGDLTGDEALADGLASDPTVKTQCIDCHDRAGGDAGIGAAFVFTQIR